MQKFSTDFIKVSLEKSYTSSVKQEFIFWSKKKNLKKDTFLF